jgi:hypothetical protein
MHFICKYSRVSKIQTQANLKDAVIRKASIIHPYRSIIVLM